MSTSNKPREWWVTGFGKPEGNLETGLTFKATQRRPTTKDSIHVIEHSAYQSAVEEMNHALAAASIHADEHRKARELIWKLEEKLDPLERFTLRTPQMKKEIREALKLIADWKGGK